MLEELVGLDLTAGEARVYLSLLRLGPSKVGAIVRESRVSYSKVYDVLERLGNKGLVSHVLIGKVRHFSAAEPYRLHDYIRKKEESLQNEKAVAERLIPGLLKYAGTGRRNSAEIFVGLKGLRTAYEILLKEAKQVMSCATSILSMTTTKWRAPSTPGCTFFRSKKGLTKGA